MIGTSATNAKDANELKELMNMIIDDCYPFVFDSSQSMVSTAEDMEQTVFTKYVKSAMDAIYNALERMYYKEKIVLFPYLEKNFQIADKASLIPAINNSVEESMRIAKLIEAFRLWVLGRDPAKKAALPDNRTIDAMGTFESAWWALCAHRNKLFESFVTLEQARS